MAAAAAAATLRLQAEVELAQRISAKPLKVCGFPIEGRLVITGPNHTKPDLLDAAVLYTNIRLGQLEPARALLIIIQAIQEAALPWEPRYGMFGLYE